VRAYTIITRRTSIQNYWNRIKKLKKEKKKKLFL